MLICDNAVIVGTRNEVGLFAGCISQEETEQQAEQCLGALFSLAEDSANSSNDIPWDARIKYSMS